MEDVVHELAKALLKYDEPIPHFTTRFPHKLESCLAVIEQLEYFNNDPILQLANLIYRLVKNHPFQNGNKRIALTTLTVVIETNSGVPEKFIKDFIKFVSKGGMTAIFLRQIANSKPHEKDRMVKLIYNYIFKISLFRKGFYPRSSNF
ncbi:Fic family protein [Patescibacteria group bacterium]|nr:Fic family protein [Patescibacteria group bacterium]